MVQPTSHGRLDQWRRRMLPKPQRSVAWKAIVNGLILAELVVGMAIAVILLRP